MGTMARVLKAEPLGGLTVRLTFSDGLVRDLDLDAMLDGGVLDQIRDPDFFAQVTVDDVAGTISWPNGVDLDPDVLHGDHGPAAGNAPNVLAEDRLRSSA